MTDADQRERLRALEVQYENLVVDLKETREVLHRVGNQMMTLQRQLDAILNQGKGATLIVRVFVAMGGLGWLAGLYSFAKMALNSWRLP